jgi:hypothetical protein
MERDSGVTLGSEMGRSSRGTVAADSLEDLKKKVEFDFFPATTE